jgi:hypothetical protein
MGASAGKNIIAIRVDFFILQKNEFICYLWGDFTIHKMMVWLNPQREMNPALKKQGRISCTIRFWWDNPEGRLFGVQV